MYEIIITLLLVLSLTIGVIMLVMPLNVLKKFKIIKEEASAIKTKVLGVIITVLTITALVI